MNLFSLRIFMREQGKIPIKIHLLLVADAMIRLMNTRANLLVKYYLP